MRNYCGYWMRLSLRSRRVSSALRAALIRHALPRGLLVLCGSSGPCVPHCVRRCWSWSCGYSYFGLRNGLRPLTLRASQRFASEASNFMFRGASRQPHFVLRSAPRLVVIAVSVRLLVLRTSQRFASPPTSRSVHPFGGDPDPRMRSLGDQIPAARRMRYALVMLRETRCAAELGARLAGWTVRGSTRCASRRDHCAMRIRSARGANAGRSLLRSAQRELPGAGRCEVRSTSSRAA